MKRKQNAKRKSHWVQMMDGIWEADAEVDADADADADEMDMQMRMQSTLK